MDSDITVEALRHDIARYCRKRGHPLWRTAVDRGVPGDQVDGRIGFTAVVDILTIEPVVLPLDEW
ncbi:hypothetical protein ACQPZF_36325 [Actinosynnema sp. CS-041913]|uniref:hypothetical protein n=1 Tax=Actinosynnema sp. CS-041913 TaxID=3239917 RepID=UPI003D8BA68C